MTLAPIEAPDQAEQAAAAGAMDRVQALALYVSSKGYFPGVRSDQDPGADLRALIARAKEADALEGALREIADDDESSPFYLQQVARAALSSPQPVRPVATVEERAKAAWLARRGPPIALPGARFELVDWDALPATIREREIAAMRAADATPTKGEANNG